MSDIGVRELKARASEVVRKVKEQRARYVITHRGRPAALLIPIDEANVPAAMVGENATAWDDLVCLGQKIAAGWQSEKSSTELLSELRR